MRLLRIGKPCWTPPAARAPSTTENLKSSLRPGRPQCKFLKFNFASKERMQAYSHMMHSVVAPFARHGAFALGLFCVLPSTSCARSESVQMPSAPESVEKLSVEDVMGSWHLASGETKGDCLIALSRFASGHGFAVTVETCSVPELTSAAAWRPTTEGFELIDARERVILQMRRANVDTFVSLDRTYELRRAAIS